MKHTHSINKVLTVCANTEAKVDSFMDGLLQAVSDAVDAKVASEGGVNISILKSTLQEMKDEIFGKIESVKINKDNASAELEQNDIPITDIVRVAGPFEFHYKGTNWPIPETFQFPKETKRLQGWRMWLKGSLIVVGSQQYRIKPFSKMSGRDLHSKELKNEYKLNWKPIFSIGMEAPGLAIPRNPTEIDKEFVQTSFTIATGYLKECYSFIFKAGDGVVCNYTIGNWSSKIKQIKVLRHVPQDDIAKLPPANSHNQPHACKHSYDVV